MVELAAQGIRYPCAAFSIPYWPLLDYNGKSVWGMRRQTLAQYDAMNRDFFAKLYPLITEAGTAWCIIGGKLRNLPQHVGEAARSAGFYISDDIIWSKKGKGQGGHVRTRQRENHEHI